MTKATRRWRWLGVPVVGALALGACGGDDGGTAAADSTATEDRSEAFPVTIGPTSSARNRRGGGARAGRDRRPPVEQDALLALGVAPVATTEWFGRHPGSIFPWATDRLEELGAEPP